MSTNQHEPQKKMGRPAKAEADRRTSSIRMGVRENLKSRLEAAAATSGRTIGEEAEARLEDAFAAETIINIVRSGHDAGQFIIKMATIIETIQVHENPIGVPLGSTNWSASPLTRAALLAAFEALCSHLIERVPTAEETDLGSAQRKMYSSAVQYMQEFGQEFAEILTGQRPELREALEREGAVEH